MASSNVLSLSSVRGSYGSLDPVQRPACFLQKTLCFYYFCYQTQAEWSMTGKVILLYISDVSIISDTYDGKLKCLLCTYIVCD